MCFMCLCFDLRSEPTKISVTGAVASPDASQQKGTENRLRACFSGVSVSETCSRYRKVDCDSERTHQLQCLLSPPLATVLIVSLKCGSWWF